MDRPSNRREHFRLPYPPGAGPVLTVRGRTIPVTELSEGGLRLAAEAGALASGERLVGVLEFSDGTRLPVEGTAARAGDSVAVVLTLGVDLPRMLTEQRRIMLAFPNFLRGGE